MSGRSDWAIPVGCRLIADGRVGPSWILLARLVTAGTRTRLDAATPAAVVQSAGSPEQKIVLGTAETLAAKAAEAGVASPALAIVGPVAALGERLAWFASAALTGAAS